MLNPPCRTAATETGNQLLANLPSDTWRHIEPDLERVELVQGQTLQRPGAALKYVYFPASAVVSLVSGMQDGGSAEVAVVGHEGMVGVCAFMGDGSALSIGVVQTAGHGWRMPAPVLASHAARHEALMLTLLQYTQALLVQLAQTSACQRHHSLLQQLCCWLLQHQDRNRSHELLVTQERIADLLGVRRETVTERAQQLQKSGLISYARGHVAILDRKGLEAHSCECYAVVKAAYDKLGGGLSPAPLADQSQRVDAGRVLPLPVRALRKPASSATFDQAATHPTTSNNDHSAPVSPARRANGL